MATVLITGASSGIGLELAKKHAINHDNMVLVARNKTVLDTLKSELENQYKINIYTIGKDLSLPNAAQDVFDEVAKQAIQIDYLINNAGIGEYGFLAESNWAKDLQMIDLNITCLTQLTKLYLPEMIKRRSGKILNVASTAAFQPGPTMAIYCASKAYVLSFSEAISNEVEKYGITVTTLCPGATESGFKAAANLDESNLFKNKQLPTSKSVAEFGFNAMMKGRGVVIHGLFNYLLANSIRFAPRAWVLKISRKFIDQ